MHPLVTLRTSIGLSHPAYARLVARTHAELGFGQMAARREKVSRWESGRTVPEPTAQLAIAHLHGIPEEAVLRLGWPHWLRLGTGDADLLTLPWTAEAAVTLLGGPSPVRTAQAPGPPQPGPPQSGPEPLVPELAVTGPVLASQLGDALAALASGGGPVVREGPPVSPEMLGRIAARITTLEALETRTPISPAALRTAALAEYRLLGGLLAGSVQGYGYDHATGARLLLLGARAAALCAWLGGALGRETEAERYALTAVRAAIAAGAPRHVAGYLALLTVRHLRRCGDFEDSLVLVGAARRALPRPAPRLAVALDTRESRALAGLGEVRQSLRLLERADRALPTAPAWQVTADPACAGVDETYLAMSHGHTWLRLGRLDLALSSYARAMDTGPDAPLALSPHLAERLRAVVLAQLALDRPEEAAAAVGRVTTLTGGLPACIAGWIRGQLAPHADRPGVPELLRTVRPETPD